MWFASSLLIASFAALTDGTEECTYALELLQVQDGSASFDNHVELMRQTTEALVNSLSVDFGEFQYGVASFVDKPIPTRGIGNYGNYASIGGPIDWCYRLEAPLSADPIDIAAGLEGLGKNMGSGGDFPENPYEGMLFAAYNKEAGWSPPSQSHADSGRPIARIIIMFTDDVPHLKGDAYAGTITGWNWPRAYDDYDYSTGGFGARSWGKTTNIFYRSDEYPDQDDYVEMCNLFRTVDTGDTLSTSEEKRLDSLIDKFGPYPWPAILDHPGDDSLGCDLTEYPSLDQLGDALRKFKITPIILLARPAQISTDTSKRCRSIGASLDNDEHDIMDCLVTQYTQDLATMGVSGVVDTISSTNVLDQIVQAISKATEQICLGTSTELETTSEDNTTSEQTADSESTGETPTTKESTSTADETTGDVSPATDETTGDVSPATDETTGDVSPATDETTGDVSPATDETTGDVSPATDETTGDVSPATDETTGDVSPATDETTEEVSTKTTKAISTTPAQEDSTSQQTTSSKKASVIPVIAGATGGAVAAAGIVAGVLYKKFGMSMFGGQGAADPNAVQQVDTPESPVERETMEEVTMDMFQ